MVSSSANETDASSTLEEEDEEGIASWEEWQADGGDEGDQEATKSLLDGTVLPSVEAALEHDAEKHGLDLRKQRAEVCQRCLSDTSVLRPALWSTFRLRAKARAPDFASLRQEAAAAPRVHVSDPSISWPARGHTI